MLRVSSTMQLGPMSTYTIAVDSPLESSDGLVVVLFGRPADLLNWTHNVKGYRIAYKRGVYQGQTQHTLTVQTETHASFPKHVHYNKIQADTTFDPHAATTNLTHVLVDI